ncbi:alpha-hydroxy-acid oxidizing protein [Parapedobacter indicus]|uniref:Lactate 2-monooxygenase n=1 Tax=Parapedobacter indicus TaxID=1477437 RepID=A0A1I3T7I8_9SPHI|nr:alpha-hydroxy-acid oxidizing protein [Parapedobacter indicus]PPK99611.1 lactate 2-monooxygenase [Parapedobacter indicus]SFJ66580.1 lactate 2-monooxygenase [Parapedobacter indicus]
MAYIDALQRQKAIFLGGMSGKRAVVPFQAAGLRIAAKQQLSARAWAYIDGGAGDETSIAANAAAFSDISILPRMMGGEGPADFSTRLLNTDLAFPLLLAPIGVLDLICPEADRVVARACRNVGIPMIFSNQAGTPMETCAQDLGDTSRWFQLYWSKSDDLVLSFIQRAEACGCSAIVLTVDTTLLGWRSRDLALGYLPFLRGMGIAQYTSDPVFQALLNQGAGAAITGAPKPTVTLQTIANLLQLKANYPGGFFHNLFRKTPLEAVRLFINIYSNPALSWEQVIWLRQQTKLPILIKGILRADDALKAMDAGADGIVVSNHGGRQVDGAISSLPALKTIRQTLPKPFPIVLDSGIRSGSDVFKALALGADAVLLGRPYAYGLAVGGQRGVEEVILNMLNDFELTAQLAGCRNIQEIDGSMVG